MRGGIGRGEASSPRMCADRGQVVRHRTAEGLHRPSRRTDRSCELQHAEVPLSLSANRYVSPEVQPRRRLPAQFAARNSAKQYHARTSASNAYQSHQLSHA